MQDVQSKHAAERFASDFVRVLRLGGELEQRCEWSCLLWSKDYWAERARKAKVDLEQSKQRSSIGRPDKVEPLFENSQFINTIAQVYSHLFDSEDRTCSTKTFPNCPFLGQRQDLLNKGGLASVFVTILHRAVSYSMLEKHPLDNGLLDEEYKNAYGVDMTDFYDLELSLKDGRFELLFRNVVKHATELAGLQ